MPGKADPNAVPKATAKKLAFAAAYVRLNHGTKAAIEAGYSAKTARNIVSRLLSDVVVSTEVDRLRAQISRQIERSTIATLTEIKERFTGHLRGDRHAKDIADLEANAAAIRSAVRALKRSGAAPDVILRERRLSAAYDLEIKKLRLAQEAEAIKAGAFLARMSGALDPSRKPLPNKGDAIERLFLAMVKAVPGPDLREKIRQLKGQAIDVTPVPAQEPSVPSLPSDPGPDR